MVDRPQLINQFTYSRSGRSGSKGAYPLPGRRADLIDTVVVHMKAETTANGPHTSLKTPSTGPRQVVTSRKRDEGETAPRK